MRQFHYHRVVNLKELIDLVQSKEYDLMIIEGLDHILREPQTGSYDEQNRKLHHLMISSVEFIFLDDWKYIDRYYLRDVYIEAQKRQRLR